MPSAVIHCGFMLKARQNGGIAKSRMFSRTIIAILDDSLPRLMN